MSSAPLSPASGRLCVLLAALIWSTSGAFAKVLTKPTFVGAHEPAIEPLTIAGADFPVQIACYRGLFAALALTPLLSWRELRITPIMIVMGLFFAAMNILYVTSMALGTAANAIFLQYSAPLWMYLACVFLLGEPPDRKSTLTLVIGLVGILVIVMGGWHEGEIVTVLIALGSGLTYAGVVVCLRLLRTESSCWLTVWNHALAGLVLVPLILSLRPPTWQQFVVLFFFGAFQMALAYWLMARALQAVTPAEAGTLTLFEPLLNPLWAYWIAGEVPSPWTFVGGAIILGALAWRYWPWQRRPGPEPVE